MAKGKGLNPADAHRKAQRKKELKKNRVERQKTRDFGLVKKDTSELENEISGLETLGDGLKAAQKHRLTEAKAELKRIMDKKEEYLTEHPEQRHLVYKRKRETERDDDGDGKKDSAAPPLKARRLFYDKGPKKGLPRHPERSIYYDPIMNPHGMPPPGMPYVERPLLSGEIDSDAEPEAEASEDSDDDIPMPAGPPPGVTTTDDDSEDDDIPLPPGPPPSAQGSNFVPPLPPGPPPPFVVNQNVPLPAPPYPPIPTPGPMSSLPPPPPPPLMFAAQGAPTWLPPPPPPMSHMPYGVPPPPPPPGFFPRNRGPKNSSVIQDPLSDAPHMTFQERRDIRQAGSSLPAHPSLPARPVTSAATPTSSTSQNMPSTGTASASTSATISAEPELRDFRKESTVFVPAALRRKKAKTVNAAPAVAPKDGASDTEQTNIGVEAKPDLLGTLREKLGPMMPVDMKSSDDAAQKRRRLDDSKALESKQKQGTDDYENFLAEMGDLLNAPQ